VSTPAPAAAPQTATGLQVDGLVTAYGSVEVLHGVALEAPLGQVTCVMGRNGVGKTTLMRTIMGQIRAKTGSVHLGGRDLSAAPAHVRARSGIALVPQGREIFPKLTVRENLEIGFSARGSVDHTAVEAGMDMFPILRQFAKRNGGDLSGGQQQQLAIARALVGKPSVLLLDEPTEGIQPNIIEEIGRVLRRLASEGMAVVLVEQYLDFVKENGDRFAIMDRGQVVARGTTAELSGEVVGRWLSV
jgi:urea transport system ATP-binding protein